MSSVLVADSTYDTCREAVDRAFATFPIDICGKRVALKMNALKAGDPDRYAYVTYRLIPRSRQWIKK
jgi:uncharacterized protein (DUF362 family)